MNAHLTNTARGGRTSIQLLSGVLVAGLCLGSFGFPWQRQAANAHGRLSEEAAVQLYEKAVESVAWVKTPRGYGTAWVVHAGKGLAVTALHVVTNGNGGVFNLIELYFPRRDAHGEVIHATKHYMNNASNAPVLAEVIHYDIRRDMAVLKLRTVPAGLRALPLASGLPKAGQEVHVIGSEAVNYGGLFGYCNGYVRNVFHWAQSGINAHVVAHQVPTNHGDSGGPVLNNQGEVVAFISQGTTGGLSATDVCDLLKSQQPGQAAAPGPFDHVQVLDHSIAVNEIRAVLMDMQKKGGS